MKKCFKILLDLFLFLCVPFFLWEKLGMLSYKMGEDRPIEGKKS